MADFRPCAVPSCPALAVGGVYCPIHRYAQPATTSAICPRCHKGIARGQLTRTLPGVCRTLIHAWCSLEAPAVVRAPKRKKAKARPLFDEPTP